MGGDGRGARGRCAYSIQRAALKTCGMDCALTRATTKTKTDIDIDIDTLQAVAYAHCRDSEDIDTDSLGGSRQHGIALCTRHIGVRMGCDIEYCVELDWIGLDWIGWGEHMHRLG